jgi:hypothetical protein
MISPFQTLANHYRQWRHNARPESQKILENTWNAFHQALHDFSLSVIAEEERYYLEALWIRYFSNPEGPGYHIVLDEDGCMDIGESGSVWTLGLIGKKWEKFFFRDGHDRNISIDTLPPMVRQFVDEVLSPSKKLPEILYKCPQKSTGELVNHF